MRRTTATLATLALLGMTGALGACGSEDSTPTSGSDGAGGTSEAPASEDPAGGTGDELAAADGLPCPDVLPEADGGEPVGSASVAPAPAPVQGAWVCEYASGDGWELQGEAVEVAPDAVPALELQPTDSNRMCTEEIGPRWLLVTDAGGGDLTGVLVDDFGCDDVRVTPDPATVAAGTADEGGAVSGVLAGQEGLASELAALHAG